MVVYYQARWEEAVSCHSFLYGALVLDLRAVLFFRYGDACLVKYWVHALYVWAVMFLKCGDACSYLVGVKV